MSSFAAWKMAIGLGMVLCCACYEQSSVDLRAPARPVSRSVAGTETTFTVQLVESLDSSMPPPGSPFEAITLSPIVATDGSVIAMGGATVVGHASGVPGPDGNGLRLRFDSIETTAGMTSLFATLAPHQADPTLAATDVRGPGPGYDALLGLRHVAPAAIGGGPGEEQPPRTTEPRSDAMPAPPPSFRLPAGARVELFLTRPLAASRSDAHP